MLPDADADPRKDAILKAAIEAFSQYGYKRTSMEELAGRAGMSRAAVYLHFKNKEHVFRTLSEVFHARAAARVQEALAAEGDVAETLFRAFEAKDLEMFEVVYGSPHGAQLVDANFEIGADISEEAEALFVKRLARWLGREDRAGRIDLARVGKNARGAAELLLQAARGL